MCCSGLCFCLTLTHSLSCSAIHSGLLAEILSTIIINCIQSMFLSLFDYLFYCIGLYSTHMLLLNAIKTRVRFHLRVCPSRACCSHCIIRFFSGIGYYSSITRINYWFLRKPQSHHDLPEAFGFLLEIIP